MLLFYGAFIGALVPIIWITYLRKIDLFEQEKLAPIIVVFLLSTLTPYLIFIIQDYIITPSGFALNGDPFNDFMYCIFGIGLPEELVKILPVAGILLFYKRLVSEPFDIIIYAGVAALGFSFHENILYVFQYGYGVIPGRSIISSPFHMFCSSIFIYGFVVMRYSKDVKNKLVTLLKYPVFAIVSHGIFDFFLIMDYPFLYLVSFFYFMLIISVYAVIVNNSLNHSAFFTSKVVIDSQVTSKTIFRLYGILLFLYVAGGFFESAKHGVLAVTTSFNKVNAGLVVVMVIRLTRIKLKQEEWFPVKMELPITFANNRIAIKGDGFNETYMNQYLEREVGIFPFPARLNPDGETFRAFVEKKIYTDELDAYYLTRVYNDDKNPEAFEYFIMYPKRKGVTEFNPKKPIAALLKIEDLSILDDPKTEISKLPFVSWVNIIPEKK